ncbi:hypothetical protein LUX57_24120 [Actinomadura madurae]|uniref:hypothetical protein n=1 Tax=Actinomadura madurae TaxID=1993 RepID=UPI0020D220C9|nr:hypothetical protein [Actinomadura madurae]MCP9967845.1 hypothetical protein [Actinomadura madurae]
MTTTSDHVELVTELVRLLETRILDPLEILLASDDLLGPIRARLRVEAEVWAAQLLGPDRERATLTAVRIIAVLFPGDGPFDPPAPWWRTALGRAVARTAGHPAVAAVSYSTAGAMLGITRQGGRRPDQTRQARQALRRWRHDLLHPRSAQPSGEFSWHRTT